MPVRPLPPRPSRPAARFLAILQAPAPLQAASLAFLLTLLAIAALAGADLALAQGTPFGVGRPPAAPPAPPPEGFFAWVAAEQSRFYRSLSAAVRAVKTDPLAVTTLASLSFAYGVLHAVGPGHGKAVISSYLLATEETLKRGLAVTFLAALLQAVVAIAVVAVLSLAFGATARATGTAVEWIELVAYALVVAIGVWLVAVKGRRLVAAIGAWRRGEPLAGDCDPGCTHAHTPPPDTLAGPGGWRRAAAAVLAMGLRPCTGALVVLVFAMAQGVFWVGAVSAGVMAVGTGIAVAVVAILTVAAKRLAVRLAANRVGRGTLVLAGLELLAALALVALGVALLGGYLASERVLPF